MSQESFEDIVGSGILTDILNYLKTKDLLDHKTDFAFEKIYWLCKDKSFWKDCINILRDRGYYIPRIWTYGFMHKDEQTIKEYLEIIDSS